jgi:hypothetical protein
VLRVKLPHSVIFKLQTCVILKTNTVLRVKWPPYVICKITKLCYKENCRNTYKCHALLYVKLKPCFTYKCKTGLYVKMPKYVITKTATRSYSSKGLNELYVKMPKYVIPKTATRCYSSKRTQSVIRKTTKLCFK